MKHLLSFVAASVFTFGAATGANASAIYGSFTGTIDENSFAEFQPIPDGTPVSGVFDFSNSIPTAFGNWESFSFNVTVGSTNIQSGEGSFYPLLGIEYPTGDATFFSDTSTLIVLNGTVYTECCGGSLSFSLNRYGAYPYDWRYSADVFPTNGYSNLIIYNPSEAEAAFLSFDLTELKVTYVPEPATWALVLIGIGTMGAALRARRIFTPLWGPRSSGKAPSATTP